LLGTGGFADVFLFRQDMPNREVAVKVLLHDISNDDVKQMFRFEMDAMGRLGGHPSILTVHQAGISSDGRGFMVMEYCPEGLGRAWRDRPLPLADVLHIGVKIGSALETAHRASVVHRDIKPSNILWTAYGKPVLADFGISNRLASSTESSVVAMSVPWSAPEIIRGDVLANKQADVHAEVYSLGATLYSLLAGRSPFELADSGQNSRDNLKSRILKGLYSPVGRADVPDAVEKVLNKAMFRDAPHRYASMLEFVSELQDVQRLLGLPVSDLELPTNLHAQYEPVVAPAKSTEINPVVPGGGVYVEVESKRRRAQRS
jgi:serine/threonine protein kinase